MSKWLAGKWGAARALATIARHFSNWREVWAAYRAGADIPLLVTRGGTRIAAAPGSDPIGLFWEVWRDHCYSARVFYSPRPDQTVVDLGANQGFFALYLCERARGIRVHCFEPATATRARLLANVGDNGLGRDVSVYPYAVSDRHTEALLHISPNNGHGSMFESRFIGPDRERVECVPLSRAIELTGAGRVDLLKVDVEGAEVEIIEGAGPGVWPRIDRVVVEYHDLFRPGCRDRVAAALKAGGYHVRVKPMHGNPLLGIIEATRATPAPLRLPSFAFPGAAAR